MSFSNFKVQAPSNIALIKYWGKKENQIPQNPSLSMTLSKSVTINDFKVKSGHGELDFSFNEKVSNQFSSKIENLFLMLKKKYPILNEYHFTVQSMNTFPHSSGIASSASSMAAFSYGILSFLNQLKVLSTDVLVETSYFARLGSGSACRSVYGPFVEWGITSNDYAKTVLNHTSLNQLRDSIFIVSDQPKKISSSKGHQLMNTNPFAKVRYERANHKVIKVAELLKTGDWETLGPMIEAEALELHGLMLMGDSPFFLIEPETIKLINYIQNYREKTKAQIYFTLDAGPNVHLLYPQTFDQEVKEISKLFLSEGWIKSVIHDHAGDGVKYL